MRSQERSNYPATMPKRTHSHRVRDIASLAVETVFATNGWPTEPILKDYGIDLLVQPCKDDDVEEFKLWVQVKGVQIMDAADAWQVTVEHARDWARSKEYVVFVVWNLKTSTGEFCLPRHQISEWELMQAGTKKVSLHSDGAFDVWSLQKLHVIAQLDHYHHRVVTQKVNSAWRPLQATAGVQTVETTVRDVVLAASDFLIRLGMLAAGTGRFVLDSEMVDLWKNTEPNLDLLNGLVDPNLNLETARLLLATVQWIERKTTFVPPLELTHTAAQVLNVMMENGFIERLSP